MTIGHSLGQRMSIIDSLQLYNTVIDVYRKSKRGHPTGMGSESLPTAIGLVDTLCEK